MHPPSLKANKVVVFQPIVPQYRIGFFRALSEALNGQLEVCATQSEQKGFEISGGDSCGFRLRNIRTLSCLFLGKKIMVQPYVIRTLMRRDVDVIITMNQMTRPEIWMVLMLKPFFRKKVVLWGHGFVPRDGSVTEWLRKRMVTMADAAIFYSYSAKEQAKLLGLLEKKLFVAPNALNTERIELEKSKVDSGSLRLFAEQKDLSGKFPILFVGRLLDYKRPEILIKALPRILEEIPNAVALFIGAGPCLETLKELTDFMGLTDSVYFEGAVFDEADLSRYFMLAKVGVMPAHAGLFIQHAFQYGLPVVTGNDMDNHPPEIELLVHRENGLFFRDGDKSDAANKIIEILCDEPLRIVFGENAMRVIRDRNNINTMCSGFMDAIEFVRGKRENTVSS